MEVWLSPAVSTRDPIINLRALEFSSRADNGREVILRAMTKTPCSNMFITKSFLHF